MNRNLFPKLAVAALATVCASTASAQATFPTSSSVAPRAPGVVPLQCNSGLTACTPVSGTNPAPTQGNVAHDAVNSGNPVLVGGVAGDVAPAAVADGDRVNLRLGLKGQTYTSIVSQTAGAYVDVGGDGDTEVFPNSLAARAMLKVKDPATGFAVSARGDTNGLVVQSSTIGTRWSYTSGTSPILSNTTTAVTIKTAAGASVRNYIDACQFTTTAFGAAVPLAIRDGAGGTVKWALIVPTGGFLQPAIIKFDPPLQSTANTLLEVVTTTANTSGTVTFNCQGHTGS